MSDNEIAPGALLGERYRLEGVVGSGGMAAVWRATDEQLGRPVAVKVLSEALAAQEDFRKRFEREARTAASILSPHVVKVFDYGVAGERPYLVMEYVGGPSLAEAVAAGSPPVDPRQVAVELLGALKAIHDAGIVHRDGKPANILRGDDGRWRLTDFGIARHSDATQITQTGQVLGTLGYMAPEVREGGPATPSADLYGAGVVISDCLGDDPPPDLVLLAAELTRDDPGARPASAGAALAILDEPGLPAAAEPRHVEIAISPAVVALVLGAIAAVAIALLTGGGGDNGRKADAKASNGSQATASTPTVMKTPTDAVSSAAATTPTPTSSCDQLEEQKKALDEKAHNAEKGADLEAKKAIHDQFDDRSHSIDEQIKDCKAAEKEGD